MTIILRILAAVWLVCCAAPLCAALPALSPEPAEPQATPTAASGALSDERDPGADSRIATRLRDIYAEVDTFSNIEVAVNQGVVRLTGSAPSQEAIDEAGAIAARFDVVTVENEIGRDTSLSGTANIVTALLDRLRDAAGMLAVF